MYVGSEFDQWRIQNQKFGTTFTTQHTTKNTKNTMAMVPPARCFPVASILKKASKIAIHHMIDNDLHNTAI